MTAPQRLNTHQKALGINLDPLRYGTFAEIGAGQEVVRWFFRVGGAAGTISKSISAYDMTVSDAIYGTCSRYVCRERLEDMLKYEHDLNVSLLSSERGGETAFFAFADTVSARNFRGTNYCHGWMGVRFQVQPGDPESEVIIHVRMRDKEATLQQEALAVVGVNLLHGAFELHEDPCALIESLLDDLGTDRIEIDMIEFSGAAFSDVDNRIMSLKLVELGLSDAALFSAFGEVLQPSELFYKRPVLIHRGRYRPMTLVNVDILECARARLSEETQGASRIGIQVAEMTMALANRTESGQVDLEDFIARADVIAASGMTVLVSNYTEFHSLVAYLGQLTSERIGIALGAGALVEILGPGSDGKASDETASDESTSSHVLESVGLLFRKNVKLYVYPYRSPSGGVITVADLNVGSRKLLDHLVEAGFVEGLEGYDESCLDIYSPEVLEMIREGTPGWEKLVPEGVADVIRERGYFHYKEPVV